MNKLNLSNKIINIIYCIFIVLLSSFNAKAQPVIKDDYARIELLVAEVEKDQAKLGIAFTLAPKWKIYWQQAGDVGFPPEFTFKTNNTPLDAQILWPYPKREGVYYGDIYLESYIYEEEVVFPVTLPLEQAGTSHQITLDIHYAICHEICVPEQASLSVLLPKHYANEANRIRIEEAKAKTPQINGFEGMQIVRAAHAKAEEKEWLYIDVAAPEGLENTDVFVQAGDQFSFIKPEFYPGQQLEKGRFAFEIKQLTDQLFGTEPLYVLFVRGNQAVEQIIPAEAIELAEPLALQSTAIAPSIVLILLFALLGGFILNVMPCVLPVLSIKLLSVLKHGGKDYKHITSCFLAAALGIITSFLILAALVVGLRHLGMEVGWGFHFQEPGFIIFLVVILSLFAANMWGWFHMQLPGVLSHIVYGHKEKEGLIGHFLTGVLATILATPCTAPFLGTAIGFALSREAVHVVLIFAVMGFGMALPYVFFALRPKWITALPAPGPWMVQVKHLMGYLLIATAIWLIWVLARQIGIVAGMILAGLMLFKLFKLWLSQHIALMQHIWFRISVVALIVVTAFLLPLKLAEQQSQSVSALWEDFNEQRLGQYIEEGYVVFLDITADWCLTCQANKFLVLNTKEIETLLAKPKTIAMRADWTNKNQAIADFLRRHNRAGIPFNAVYSNKLNDPLILSELLSKQAVKEAIEKAR